MTTEDAFEKEVSANLLEFHSNKISRVVRSSLAAEGSAMASAGDRLLYNRALYDTLRYGALEFDPEWRSHLRTIGCLVTDAKGLHDHVHKTGGMASEKQAALDILLVKQLVESGALQLRWTPTWKQLADPLTKGYEWLFTGAVQTALLLSAWFKLHRTRSRRSDVQAYVVHNVSGARIEFKNPLSQHLFPLM